MFGTSGYKGNPTTVHKLKFETDDQILFDHSKKLATVDNAYFYRIKKSNIFALKCFSHSGEIKICGHALLATSNYLRNTEIIRDFCLKSSCCQHQCRADDAGPAISLPLYSYKNTNTPQLEKLLIAAKIMPRELLLFPGNVYLAIVDSVDDIKKFQRDSFAWETLDSLAPGALILSCRLSTGGYAFRYFSPWFGKLEDQGTGSAHCYLASRWLKPGQKVSAQQLSPEGMAEMNIERVGNVKSLKGVTGHEKEDYSFWLSGYVEEA